MFKYNGLRNIARKAVQDISGRVRFGQTLADQIHNVIIGNKVPGSNSFLHFKAKRSPTGDLISDQIARGYMRYSKVIGETLALCSLAGSRRSQKY